MSTQLETWTRDNPPPATLRSALAAIMAAEPLLQDYGMTPEKASARIERICADPESLLVVASAGAQGGAQALGFAWVDRGGGFGVSPYLRLLAVAQDAQGRGVGKLLVAEMERQVMGAYGLFALCNSRNARALQFYQSLGYAVLGEIPGFVQAGQDEKILFKPGKR